MTKNLTSTSETLPAAMELDLDSFLNSPLTSDDDDDDNKDNHHSLNSIPHRTIDEILNASDSSTSSPPTSPPSVYSRISDPKLDQDDTVSVSTTKQPSSDFSSIPAQHHDENPSLQSRPGSSSFSRVRPGINYPDDPFKRLSNSKPLPSLFGGVRSNAKPGAALAAAVAASRALPTPHAAAIKSRRAASGSFQKVLEDSDAVSVSASDELSSNSEIRNAKEDEVLEGVIGNEGFAQGSSVKEVESEAGNVVQVDGLKVSSNHEELLRTSADSVSNFDIIEPRIGSSSISVEEDKNNVNVDENTSVLDRSSEILNSEDDKVDHLEDKVEEESTIEALETQQQVNVLEDTEVGGVGGGDDDDDASSLSDITELVEERIGQLESRRIRKRAEKKSRAASMKPLELAEELEKKHASTGLHWEEGAAAQPMRLEGVRRGSTTLGYFDIDEDNAITRTISSQAFRRDHGSPQALAVHTNYIAIGMSKGVILVVPSKYSGYNADHMDPKVTFALICLYCSYLLAFHVPSGFYVSICYLFIFWLKLE